MNFNHPEKHLKRRSSPLLAGLGAFLMTVGGANAADKKYAPVKAPWMKDPIYDSRYDSQAPRWIRECLLVEKRAREALRRRQSPNFEEVFNCPDLPEIIDPLYDQILSPAERERRRHPQVP